MSDSHFPVSLQRVESLQQLREHALNCQRCPLSEKRTQVVFGEGDLTSPLVLVGEGPGDQEDRSGRPFVGKAGHLLDKAIVEAGLSRSELYITNTVKCRAADWSSGKPQNRPPTPRETLECRHWLVPQLELLAPFVILCIGAPSAKNLIKKDFKITQERGKYFPSEFSRTAIATLHPSYILRNQHSGSDGGYAHLVADIQLAWDTAIRLREKFQNS